MPQAILERRPNPSMMPVMKNTTPKETLLIALGGNALIRKGQQGTVEKHIVESALNSEQLQSAVAKAQKRTRNWFEFYAEFQYLSADGKIFACDKRREKNGT
jgi:hypothetical protein